MFLEFTYTSGRVFYLNVDHVVTFTDTEDGNTQIIYSDGEADYIKGTAFEMMEKISKSKAAYMTNIGIKLATHLGLNNLIRALEK